MKGQRVARLWSKDSINLVNGPNYNITEISNAQHIFFRIKPIFFQNILGRNPTPKIQTISRLPPLRQPAPPVQVPGKLLFGKHTSGGIERLDEFPLVGEVGKL